MVQIAAPACRGHNVSNILRAILTGLLQCSAGNTYCNAKNTNRFISLLKLAVIALVWQTAFAKAAESSRLEPTAQLQPWIGTPAAPFTLDDISGQQRPLESFRGRIVLLHFFATWCAPCVEEFASLQKLTDASHDLPITVVAVDVAEVDVRVRNFVAKLGVHFPVLLDRDRAVTKAWSIVSLPTTIVLDSNLTPRFIVEDAIDWTRADIRVSIDKLYQPIKKTECTKSTFGAGVCIPSTQHASLGEN